MIQELNTKWKCSVIIILTDHISTFCDKVTKINKACKHTTHTPMTENQKVLDFKDTIETTNTLLQVHIAKVNSNPNGLENNFKYMANQLMIADPVVEKKSKSSKWVTISVIDGRGPKTGVDLRYHDNEEWKKLSRADKKEIFEWQKRQMKKQLLKLLKCL